MRLKMNNKGSASARLPIIAGVLALAIGGVMGIAPVASASTWASISSCAAANAAAIAPNLSHSNAYASNPLFAGGDGTVAHPYQISNRAQLESLNTNVDLVAENYMGCAFIQTADISLAGADWTPIGRDIDAGKMFSGSYDGQNFTISDLHINQPTQDHLGLFSFARDGAVISNLKMTNVNIVGHMHIAAVAAKAFHTIFNNVSVQGSITGSNNYVAAISSEVENTIFQSVRVQNATISGVRYVGGVVGYGVDVTIIDAKVNGTITASGDDVGGLGGSVSGSILQSQVTGSVSGGTRVGGLVGWLKGSEGLVVSSVYFYSENNFAKAAVTSSTGNSIGGLVGEMAAYQNYSGWIVSAARLKSAYFSGSISVPGSSSSTGGLVGTMETTLTPEYAPRLESVFWDVTGSVLNPVSVTGPVGVVGTNAFVGTDVLPKTAAQLAVLSTYSVWNSVIANPDLLVEGWLPSGTRGSAVWGRCDVINGGLPFAMATEDYPCGGPAPVPVPVPVTTVVTVVVTAPAPVVAAPDSRSISVSARGANFVLQGTGASGAPHELAADGSIVLAQTDGVDMSGSGFVPQGVVNVYLISAPALPTLLATLPVSASGAFSGKARIPAGTPGGVHNVQAIGSTATGEKISLSIAVTVESAAVARRASPIITVKGGVVKKIGAQFTVKAVGVQPRCAVTFWTDGTTVKSRAGVAGKATATLIAPGTHGNWAVTAKVSGLSCDPITAKIKIAVRG